jgi:hypothetical protein
METPMKRALVLTLYIVGLAVGITPLMGGCSDSVANILDDTSSALHDISNDISGNHDSNFWDRLFGNGNG